MNQWQAQDKGRIRWGLFGGAVVLVLVLLVIGLLAYVSQFKDINIGVGTANTDDYDITLDTCEVDGIDGARAAGMITNTGNLAQGFNIEIRFLYADGTLLDTASTSGKRLAEGETENWETSPNLDVASGEAIECEIDEVAYSILD